MPGKAMLANEMDVSKVSLSSLRTLDNGGKMIYLNYGAGGSPIYLQTPEVDIPFDVSYFPDSETSGKHAIKVSLKGMETNASVRNFHDKINELDNFLKETALKNSLPWFKKAKMSMDTIENLYTPMIKVSVDPETGEPNGKYPPQFTFKVVKRDNKYQCMVYDENKKVFDINKETDEPVDLSNILTKGAKVKAVLRCNGIWLANGKFGCTWKAEQVRVKVNETGLDAFAIRDESDDEEEQEQSTNVLVDDSDVEEEETVIEEDTKSPEPPEEPKPKKKVIRRKATN